MARKDDIRTESASSMALSVKRKTEAMEERNEIDIYSRPKAQRIGETQEFMK